MSKINLWSAILLLFIASSAFAGDRISRYGYLSDGSGGVYIINTQGAYSTLAHKRRPRINPCFPYSCGGIGPTLRNPDPDARKPENLTSCIYNAKATLVYEREGKVCPYKYIDANVRRVERRRLEYERLHKAGK